MKKYLMLITAMLMLVVAMPMAFAVDDNNTVTPDVGDGNTTVEEEGEKIVDYTADYEALDEKDDLKTKIDSFIKKISSVEYDVDDMGALATYVSENFLEYNNLFNAQYFEYKDVFDYDFEVLDNEDTAFVDVMTIKLTIKKDSKTYASVKFKIKSTNILYTYDCETEDEIIKYLEDAIKTYFGEDKVSLLEITAKEIPQDIVYPETADEEYVYNKLFNIKATINGVPMHDDFIVENYFNMGDAPIYYDEEANVGVYVDTEDEIPNDLEFKVTTITKGMDEFVKIANTIKNEKFIAFDISLYSPSADKYLTKLETGKFLVELYLGEEYVGKDMSAYYIKEDGSLEVYPLEIDEEGYATFETTHFSTYFITETLKLDSNNKVPNTVDNGVAYILAGTLGLVTMLGSAILFSKRK